MENQKSKIVVGQASGSVLVLSVLLIMVVLFLTTTKNEFLQGLVVTEKLVGGGCTEENEMDTKKVLVTRCKSSTHSRVKNTRNSYFHMSSAVRLLFRYEARI
jgi:hypothetical protein